MIYKYFLTFLLLVVTGLLQNTNLLTFYQIKPNLMLVFLIASSFFIPSLFIYLGLVLLSGILAGFRNGLELERIVLGLLGIWSFSLGRFLGWKLIYNNFFLIGISTPTFYLLTNPAFILSNWSIVLVELVYNLILGAVVFKVFEKVIYGQT